MPKLCGKTVYWWNGEYEGECERPKGHDGDHFDGLSWYDDDGNDTTNHHYDERGLNVLTPEDVKYR